MQRRKRKNMRLRKDILLALKNMSENEIQEEYLTASQIIDLIASMRDKKTRQIHSVGYPLPTTRTIGNLMRGWKGIGSKHIYKNSSKVLCYRLTDLGTAEEWLGVTV